MKQIKISEEVKKQLDTMAYDKETYNITIQRIIRENKQLKEDKDKLMKIAMKTEDSIAFPTQTHSNIWLIMNVLSSVEYTEEQRLNALKIYLRPNLEANSNEVLSNIGYIKKEFNIESEVLNDFEAYIKETY